MGFLTSCRTCDHQVSSTAKFCPHCGESSPEPYRERMKYTLIAVIGLLLIGIIIYPALVAIKMFFL